MKDFLDNHFNKIIAVIVISLLCIIYKYIFIGPITSAGDLPYYWNAYIQQIGIPQLWNPHWPTGLGGNQAVVMPLKLYFHIPILIFTQLLHIPWEIIERIVFFIAFLALSISTSYYLTKSWIGSLLYAANTWILMVFSGGQMGIALAYSIAPLVIAQFFNIVRNMNISTDTKKKGTSFLNKQLVSASFLAGLFLSIQMTFDIRIAYITILGILLFYFMTLTNGMYKQKQLFAMVTVYYLLVPGLLALLLNIYWVLPLILSGNSLQIASIQPTLEQVKFFSFATFSNTFGFLHPNWPENIFGKVGFMKPEFLFLPLLAFSSLLFLTNRSNKNKLLSASDQYTIFFALLGLLGVFLAKGANDPFGGVYLWLFENMPGFSMFRDSTKFYLLIALAYSYLIPYSLYKTSQFFANVLKKRKVFLIAGSNIYKIFTLGFILYYSVLLSPAVTGQVGGILQQNTIPKEYIDLSHYLQNEKKYVRTLWIPQQQRFGFYSNDVPAISGSDLFPKTKQNTIIKELQKKDTKSMFQNLSIKYIILPYDSNGEIFVKDRMHNEALYQKMYRDLKSIPWLKEEKKFGKVIVFSVPDPKEHFWIETKEGKEDKINGYKRISDTKYEVTLEKISKGDSLIFTEQFDKDWQLLYRDKTIGSAINNNHINSFPLDENMHSVEIYYKPQSILNWLWVFSGSMLIITIFVIFSFRRRVH